MNKQKAWFWVSILMIVFLFYFVWDGWKAQWLSSRFITDVIAGGIALIFLIISIILTNKK